MGLPCWNGHDHPAAYTTDGLACCKHHLIDGPARDRPHPGVCRGCGCIRRETWPIPSGQPDALGHPPRLCAMCLELLVRSEPWTDDRFA